MIMEFWKELSISFEKNIYENDVFVHKMFILIFMWSKKKGIAVSENEFNKVTL